jgi:hypothetical protein
LNTKLLADLDIPVAGRLFYVTDGQVRKIQLTNERRRLNLFEIVQI